MSAEFCPTGLSWRAIRIALPLSALHSLASPWRSAARTLRLRHPHVSANGLTPTLCCATGAGADLRAFLTAWAFTVGADGSAAVKDALEPSSWVLLKLHRIGAGPAPAAFASPAFVPLGRSAAAAAAVAAVAAATAAAEVAARLCLDVMAAEELRRIGDCL